MEQLDASEFLCYLIDYCYDNNIELSKLFQGSGVLTLRCCQWEDKKFSWESWSSIRVAINKKKNVNELDELLKKRTQTEILKEEPKWQCQKLLQIENKTRNFPPTKNISNEHPQVWTLWREPLAADGGEV